ncbi:hypothetical protein OG216_45950 (plasmid) [Streptomycetaceae bacterium NBC_01309]
MTSALSRTLLALGAAALAASAVPAASVATTNSRPPKVSVTGSARVFYAPAPADDVRFTFDAHALAPTAGQGPQPADARGTVRVYHRVSALNLTLWAEGEVNCVMTSGRVATLTAFVTKTSPELGGWAGKHLGFTVLDSGSHDQLGSTGPVDALAKCMAGDPNAPVMAPAPFFNLQAGGYRVKGS